MVKDIEKSKQFYHDLFGLDLLLDNDGNMILTEGLVLRDEKIWKNFLGKICWSEPSECMPAGRAPKTPPHGFFHAAALL